MLFCIDYNKERLRMFKSKFSKVSFNDKNLWKAYGSQVGIFSSIVTLFAFCIPPSDGWTWKIVCSIIFILVLGVLFVYKWYKANQLNHADLKINDTKVTVQIGDLFKQEGLQIIGVNNYMDLVADDVVVSKRTLHGKFVEQHKNEIHEIRSAISNSKTLILEKNSGKRGQQSYDYGSCVLYKDYVLTVLTKFDGRNKAYTSIQEYVQFWMTFWNNMDEIYNSRTINIPLMGAGQTRFRGSRPKKQELLEIALWTLKESGFRNNYSNGSVNFIIYEGDAPEIDFYRIQKNFR